MARKAGASRLTVGERLRYHRKVAGLSQAALGEAIDRDAAAICRMESGERQPSASQLEQIVAALGLSMSEFYGEVLAETQAAS